MQLILAIGLIASIQAISISEINNELHITGINGQSHGEIGLYPNRPGDLVTITYHTDDKIDCSHLRIRVYRGQQATSGNLVETLCSENFIETSTEGFKVIFDSDSSVHGARIDMRVYALHGVSHSSSVSSGGGIFG